MRTENCLTFLCTARFDVHQIAATLPLLFVFYTFGIQSNAKMGVKRRSNISSINIISES